MRFLGCMAALCLLACSTPVSEGTTRPHAPRHVDCEGCHVADLRRAIDPPHEGALPTTCFVCHTQASWSPTILDHEWTLTGAHVTARCLSCHVVTEEHADVRARLGAHAALPEPRFVGTSTECVGCHRDDFDRAVSTRPWHATVGNECQSCHTTTAWLPSTEPPPPPEPPDAGPSLDTTGLDGITGASHRHHGLEVRPLPVVIPDAGVDAGVDAARPRRPHRPPHEPPPHEDPLPDDPLLPDVQTSASHR